MATPLALTPPVVREVYRDRWPVKQLPLAAKQMLGAARQFVHEQETGQRFPELALLAGAVLTYAAATSPAVPTGSGDRQPRRRLGGSDTGSDRPIFRPSSRCPSAFAETWPSPTTYRKASGANDALQRPLPFSGSPDLPPTSTEVA